MSPFKYKVLLSLNNDPTLMAFIIFVGVVIIIFMFWLIIRTNKRERIKYHKDPEENQRLVQRLYDQGCEAINCGNFDDAIDNFYQIDKIGPTSKDNLDIKEHARHYVDNLARRKNLENIEKELILQKNEKIAWKGPVLFYAIEDSLLNRMHKAYIAITSENLYFISTNDIFNISLKDIISISKPKIHFRESASIYDYDLKDTVDLKVTTKIDKLHKIFINFGDYRVADIDRAYSMLLKMIEDKQNRVENKGNISIDFTSIKEYLKNGGVVMQTFKCPGCGGSLEFPDNVDVTICQYCGNKIKAVDLFEKIRNLI